MMEVVWNNKKWHIKVVNIYIVYQILLWPYIQAPDFTLENSLLRAVKLTKNIDTDKYKYFGYVIVFDACGRFSLSDGSRFRKNVITFSDDLNSSLHIDNKLKDILILGKGLTDGLDDTLLTAEKEYSMNFTEQQNRFCISLHYGVNSYIFVNSAEMKKFKPKDSKINAAPLYIVYVSKGYIFHIIKLKNTGLYRYVYDFSVDYDSIGVDDILNTNKYLMKKLDIKCLNLFKKLFIGWVIKRFHNSNFRRITSL